MGLRESLRRGLKCSSDPGFTEWMIITLVKID